MDYLFFALLFGLIIGLAWKTLLNETKISLSDISNNAIIDENKAQDIVSVMYGASQSGRKSAKFTISYPSQDAYIANITYIKRKIKSIFFRRHQGRCRSIGIQGNCRSNYYYILGVGD